ncbi:MAG: fructose-bisphosphate aldolase [Candidatus Woesearchaeota archaeon]
MHRQIGKLMTKGRSLMLACDQGFEHGPADFNLKNIDPEFIMELAEKGGFNAVILHNGIAEKYYHGFSRKVPLVVKLNGKTNIPKIEPLSANVCSLKRAVQLGADAVGFTLFVGSRYEREMYEQVSKIVEEAHDYGIPVITWAYPRGEFVPNPRATGTLAHAARVCLELGADFVKINYNGDFEGFKWVVKAAGKARVMVAGGNKVDDAEFLQKTKEVLDAGAVGIAVGRQVWQHAEPMKMIEAIKKVVFDE